MFSNTETTETLNYTDSNKTTEKKIYCQSSKIYQNYTMTVSFKVINAIVYKLRTFGVFPIIAPRLSGQITYSPPPNHGKYTIMGGLYFYGGGL